MTTNIDLMVLAALAAGSDRVIDANRAQENQRKINERIKKLLNNYADSQEAAQEKLARFRRQKNRQKYYARPEVRPYYLPPRDQDDPKVGEIGISEIDDSLYFLLGQSVDPILIESPTGYSPSAWLALPNGDSSTFGPVPTGYAFDYPSDDWVPEGNPGFAGNVNSQTNYLNYSFYKSTGGVNLYPIGLPTGRGNGILLIKWWQMLYWFADSGVNTVDLGFWTEQMDLILPEKYYYYSILEEYTSTSATIGSGLAIGGRTEAFVFNNREMRRIDVPPRVAAALDNWAPQNIIVTTEQQIPYFANGTLKHNKFGFLPTLLSYPVEYKRTRTKKDVSLSTGPLSSVGEFASWNYGLRGFHGIVGNHSVPRYSPFSPAIYLMFDRYNSSHFAIPDYPDSLQDIINYHDTNLEYYMMGEAENLPSRFLAIKDTYIYEDNPEHWQNRYIDRTYFEAQKRSDYTGHTGYWDNAEFNEEESRVRGKVRLPTTMNDISYNRVSVWDWGNPDYCRQRAVGLGFAVEDLIP